MGDTKHVCTGSDHISKLAADGGFAHWKTVWDNNGTLSAKRSNPNILFKGDKLTPAGDTVKIPDLDPGSKGANTEIFNSFSTGTDKLFLRLRILKDDFSALANAKYTLTIPGVADPLTGTTNGQGQIEKEISRSATQAKLTVSTPAASGSDGTCAESPVTWQLQIGRLNPIMENAPDQWCISGVQQRLNNLGISTGPVDGIKGKLTDAAIRVFQRLFKLSVDGAPGQGETQPKLVDAHDKPDSILGPLAPPNDSQSQATPDDAIGHVAPDFDDRKVFNTLRLRSSYRLSLRLGSIEELFPHAPDTPEGRMERLQVVGMFYYPLGHNKALQAFNGLAAAGGAPPVRGLWEHFKTRVLDKADDAAADKEIQRLLTEWVVVGGTLPTAAKDPTAPAETNFTKLHLPGAHSLLASWRTGPKLNLNRDTSAPYSNWTLSATHFDVESRFFDDNPVLRRLPLVAKVERFDQATCQWKVAEKATVFFQLVDPYPLPAFRPADPVNTQFNRPPFRKTSLGPPVAGAGTAGPDHFAQPEENPTGARAPKATDPQRGNCPHDRGGKQGSGSLDDGSDVAGTIFSTTSVPGLNAKHNAPAKGTVNPIKRTVFFPLAQRVNDSDRKHCVKAETNKEGEAGVLFLPSRAGGDRYRFRAFLGPPTVNGDGSDGKGANALAVDTGTLVTWRSMRISRFVRQPANAVDPTLLADAQANAVFLTIGNIVLPNVTNAKDYLQRVFSADGGGNIAGTNGLRDPDFTFVVPTTAGFDPLPVQWARAFVEVEFDRIANNGAPETLPDSEWEAARQQAVRDGKAGMGALGLNIDLGRLFYMGAHKPATLNASNAVVHLPMKSIQSYNVPVVQAAQRINAGGNTVAQIETLVGNYMIPGFIRFLSSNGYTPGLTLVQAAYGCTWTMFSDAAEGFYSNSSGESFDYRAGAIWGGAAAYPLTPVVPASAPTQLPWVNYGFTSNMCHEAGHTVFCLHANPPEVNNAHDPAGSNLSVCVMSYQNCEGQFCAKCMFALRGWDLSKLTY